MLQAQTVPSFIDRPVGNPKFNYYDNEYSPTTNQMIYRDATTGSSLLSNVYIVDFTHTNTLSFTLYVCVPHARKNY